MTYDPHDYDPHDYVVDSRRLGAGFGLAGAVMIGLFAISCPAASEVSGLREAAHIRGQQSISRTECSTELTSADTHLSGRGILAS
ncbi:hypothetical protein [Rhizobium ruizarguesonis]|uniref:hypothetical protein n=1 Tax=Rhizobium TaxID=379 RepID=UPI0013C1CA47|nr:hypothetical protein [Rhizobium ruizarguesonis]NEI96557.1 hypothetical protein [Rhizobium ruizarguesonis]NEJ33820.1 hypothetical protein [Rhizobium ruizarguesonis]